VLLGYFPVAAVTVCAGAHDFVKKITKYLKKNPRPVAVEALCRSI
jgi:hypothetical protein